MKTIEERAIEYAHQYRRAVHDLKGERANAAFAAYCQGAEDERKELFRWRDPKDESPEDGETVLVKISDYKYPFAVAIRVDCKCQGWVFPGLAEFAGEVTGWGPIHESDRY